MALENSVTGRITAPSIERETAGDQVEMDRDSLLAVMAGWQTSTSLSGTG
ncbi:hypothetical protein ACWEOE_26905 [Amycolatopsis sp. NPDC004368]